MKQNSANPDQTQLRLLTTNEACTSLGISRVTLWRLVRDGKLATIRFSRRGVRISSADIATFIENARVEVGLSPNGRRVNSGVS